MCRERIIPSKLIHIQYNLSMIIEPHKALNMTEEDSKDALALQNKIKDLALEIQLLRSKLEKLEKILNEKEERIQEKEAKIMYEKEKSKGYEEKYMQMREKANGFEFELEKYKDLFKNTHKKLTENETKLRKLENIAKLLSDIELTQSSVM